MSDDERCPWCLAEEVRDAACVVLDDLGSGWPEVVYQKAMEQELRLRGVSFEVHRTLPVRYRGYAVGFCVTDLVVWGDEERLVVDIKAVDYLKRGDENQVRRYVGELEAQGEGNVSGLLVNFAADGHKRRLEDLDDGDLQVVAILG